MATRIDADDLAQQLASITPDSFRGDDNAAARVLAEAQKLVKRLETPFDAIKRITFSEPTLLCCLLIADKMHLFSTLGPFPGPPKSLSDLAAPLSADPELVARVLRHLAAHQVVTDLPNNTYRATPLSATLADPRKCVGFREVANRYMPIFAQAPAWLEEHGWVCPRDARDTVFQKALGNPGQPIFDWMQLPENQWRSDEFGLLMAMGLHGAGSWLDVTSKEDLEGQIEGWDGRSVLLVDVGGSLGKDVREFRRRYPGVGGEVVLQDLSATIEKAKELQKEGTGEEIVFQAHDFFESQPVLGAKMYYMGSVLHDWRDEDAKKILRNLVAAMKPGYSTLFLSELVLPDIGCTPGISAIDICMMVELGSKERSVRDWEQLLEETGLKLVQVHTIPTTARSVIEATLK